ncbi:nucleotide-binding protein [Paraburkholderia solisilvae]|uniref:Flagellum site-determining protein YlxH n=1 Tax=Paraburkholderia solisilvae TaxID=624376 RepID=A0A6J5F159_9BURK|nr:MinD/ParA family protein [Paraburkholderia solisilvae]CAB3772094.1 Flagellum site-determining protein YlxH [Paraburkholderia solisilvae]
MANKFVSDQAEGLRRLLARHGSRAIAVTGGSAGVGCSTMVVNLAAALAAQGKDVLVVDEHAGEPDAIVAQPDGVAAGRFVAFARGEIALDAATERHSAGFAVLAAPRSHRELCKPSQLAAVFDSPADVVLIDVQFERDGMLSDLALQAHDLMMVTRVAAQAITDTYACMKRLHYAYAIAQFRVLVNHVHSVADAQLALDNLADVAGRYLTVALEGAGCVAADPLIARSGELSRCIVEAFPSAPAARDFRHLAAELQYWPMRPAMSSRAPWAAGAAVTSASHAEQPSAQHA